MNKELDVAIYTGPLSSTLLRDRSGGRSRIGNLRFSSGLPGGFLEASFTVGQQSSEACLISEGQKVVIRRGRQTVWWGWVEDITQRVRGKVVELQVTCLGPWQELQQRNIVSVNYTSDQQGGSAIATEMVANCPSISADHSHILSTGVSIGPLLKSYWPVADLVKLVLNAGDADGNPLLFAIWEPPQHEEAVDVLRSRNVLLNSNFDGPDWFGWEVNYEVNGDYEIINTAWVSPTRSGKVYSTSEVAIGECRLRNVYAGATAGSTYRFEYSIYFPAFTGIEARVEVGWYNASNVFISLSTSSYTNSSGTAGWQSTYADFTAPAGAVWMIGYITSKWPAGTNKYVGWDECYLSMLATSEQLATKPRAELWTRDLSDYDFNLWTSLLDDPLDDTETTRELVNAVVASYAGSSYTALAQDAASQAIYRRRDYLLAAGSDAGGTLAAQLRDTYLLQHGLPTVDVGGFAVSKARAITNKKNRPVELTDVRAGHRLRLADGPRAGSVIMLSAVEWSDGVLRCTPEGDYSLAQLVG